MSAFGNQIGGYLIIGARWDRQARQWLLPGVKIPEPEADTWLSNIIESVRPVPRFDLKSWRDEDEPGRVIALVRVEPVDEPPCMTSQGHAYERVSGKSVRVTDPALLDCLIRRGRERRTDAQGFARQAAARVLELPAWEPAWSVGSRWPWRRLGAPVDQPKRGRVRRDRPEQRVLISLRAEIGHALAAISKHHRHVPDHPAGVMTRDAAACRPT